MAERKIGEEIRRRNIESEISVFKLRQNSCSAINLMKSENDAFSKKVHA